jgi:hypothetical protein
MVAGSSPDEVYFFQLTYSFQPHYVPGVDSDILCPCKGVIRKTIGATQFVESQPVKRRLGGWCEMAASQEVSQLRV